VPGGDARATITDGPIALGSNVWPNNHWSPAKPKPASYSAEVSRPFPISGGAAGRADGGADACGTPPVDAAASDVGRKCGEGFCGSFSLCPPGKFYCFTSSKCFNTEAEVLQDCGTANCRACGEPPVPWCGSSDCAACAAGGGGLWWCETDKTCTNLLNDFAVASCPVQRCTCRN